MLPDYPNFILFLTAAITLALIPGADVLFIASQSMMSKRQGVFATMGISTGIGLYIVLTAFGLASIMHQSPLIFNGIKIIGAGYLLYLAWKLYFLKEAKLVLKKEKVASGYKAYYRGIGTTLLNPKVGIFLLTFLPQFVEPEHGTIWLQLLSLGACFLVVGTITNTMYAFLFAQLRDKLFNKSHIQQWLDKFTAVIFCFIAFKIITTKQML